MLGRLGKTFSVFFRRISAGGKPGYPRLRGVVRFEMVDFPRYGDGCQ